MIPSSPKSSAQHPLARVELLLEKLGISKPSTVSNGCSHSHAIAAVNREDRNYRNLEQTTPKAICKQALSAECFVERIKTEPFHPQPADHGQSTEQICKEAGIGAILKQRSHAGK